jgi:hypothetical protein
MLLENHNAIEVGGYAINNSLRFQAASTQYLNRTFGSAGNRKTWTWSAWVKRGLLSESAVYALFGTGDFSGASGNYIWINGDKIGLTADRGATNETVASAAVLRDPSSWYHIVVACDTSQATNTNRVKIYLNGVQQTLTGTYPTQNLDMYINQAVNHFIGSRRSFFTDMYFDGYIAEQHFVNAHQLTPSSFGETDATTGQWVAKKYTGTYGTNGFYLPFSDGTSTTTLGADSSGNSNNWTLNNFTRSAGVSDCWMIDVPSGNGGASGTQPSSNYCLLNTLDKGNVTLSKANLNIVRTSSTTDWEHVRSTIQTPSSGKWYAELTFNSGSNDGAFIGLCQSTFSLSSDFGGGTFANTYGYTTLGFLINNNSASLIYSSASAGEVIMIAFDRDSSKMWLGKNGTWFASGNPSSGTNEAASNLASDLFFVAGARSTANADANFGQRSFDYTPPTGFKALCTANLPEATIKKGNQYMDATTYTGNATARSITNSGSMQPDLVWIKSRSNTWSHMLQDAVRGSVYSLSSNSTGAEIDQTGFGVSSFNSNGFSLATGGSFNNNGDTYVAWQWDAGSSTVTNTNGSISSQVRANPTAGVSVVTYTSQASGTSTVGHGLGVAPKMIIIKLRGIANNWTVYHASTGATGYLNLNTTGAFTTSSGTFANTAPTSSVFTLGTDWAGSYTSVAYCFSEIAGFSKFGSYTGNGSADGVFVYTGFRPKFVMVKCSSSDQAGNASWRIFDTSRNPSNITNNELYADLSNAENTSDRMDILSNGFKLRATTSGANANAATYIYMAFAESPFQNSNSR